jgi:hypothetical protein
MLMGFAKHWDCDKKSLRDKGIMVPEIAPGSGEKQCGLYLLGVAIMHRPVKMQVLALVANSDF